MQGGHGVTTPSKPMSFRLLSLLFATCLSLAARPWTDEVVYFALTDRFRDGDPANNTPAGCDPSLHDPAQQDINRYMGGDLRGLETAVADGYFTRLGATALWLTPVVRNAWRSGYDLGGWKTGYHGYWAQDWLDIDPHLTSRAALDGTPYPDDAEGRMRHYRDFVRLAHSKGLRVIQDVVLNHAGPVFFYDTNGNGAFDEQVENEWVRPFKRDGFHATAKWAEVAKWNLRRTQPDGPRQLLGTSVATTGALSRLEAYGRKGFSPESLGKSDGEEVECDFFSLRDIWTAPGGAHFDALVDEFVTIYHFYLNTVGVDGLRIDTVKHVHHGFWDAFTARLRQRLGPAAAEKLMFGEVYDGNPAVLGRYTWRSDGGAGPCLDAVLDFQTCFAAREYLRHPVGNHGNARALEQALAGRAGKDAAGRPHYNPAPGPDGLNAQQKIITFIENHDGLNRFRAKGVTARRHRLAQALVLTLPGIPCLYYGAEVALEDPRGKIGQDGETGRLMLFPNKGGLSPAKALDSSAFREIAKLTALRSELPVLRTGRFIPLWVDSPGGPEDDGILAFARASDDNREGVVVVFNASDRAAVTGAGGLALQLPSGLAADGARLLPRLVVGPELVSGLPTVEAGGRLRLEVPAQSAVIYQIKRGSP